MSTTTSTRSPAVTCYRVTDTQTGRQVGADHKTRRTANRSADRLNWQYGAHRYNVRAVWIDEESIVIEPRGAKPARIIDSMTAAERGEFLRQAAEADATAEPIPATFAPHYCRFAGETWWRLNCPTASLFHRMLMGRTCADARAALAELNASRAALGLAPFAVF